MRITRNPRIILILMAASLGVAAFSFLKYASVVKEKYDLANALGQAKEQLNSLEQQKQNLLQEIEKEKSLQQQVQQENLQLKDGLKASEEKVKSLEAGLAEAQKGIEQLNTGIYLLEAENKGLRQEKEIMQARFSSVPELKKAIAEIKARARQARIERLKESDLKKLLSGNRGYLTKDGSTTSSSRVKIEVKPALY